MLLTFEASWAGCGVSDLSGAVWVSRFPGSSAISDLETSFQANVASFKAAIESAGGTTNVTSTKRPPERAYLMHWSWKIVKAGADPTAIPARTGVDINWNHGSARASVAGAQAMVDGFGINGLAVAPALNSRHVEGKAIDMHVSWTGTLQIQRQNGTSQGITSTPRSAVNTDLIAVGATYGVVHFLNASADPPHWSTDGH